MSFILFIGDFPSFLFVEDSVFFRFMSAFDRKIERFGHFLGCLYRRGRRPVKKTITTPFIVNNMESQETSDTTPLLNNDVELHENKIQLQSSSLAMTIEENLIKQVILLIVINSSLSFDRQNYIPLHLLLHPVPEPRLLQPVQEHLALQLTLGHLQLVLEDLPLVGNLKCHIAHQVDQLPPSWQKIKIIQLKIK